MKGLHNLGEDFIYRALRSNEDPYTDIVCKDLSSNRTVNEHVRSGLTFPSKYISTTASSRSAEKWLSTAANMSLIVYKRSTIIVKIDVNYLKSRYPSLVSCAYNFTDESVIDAFLTGKSKEFAARYKEIVFEKCIPVDAICDIHVEGKGWIGTQPSQSVLALISTPTSSTSTPLLRFTSDIYGFISPTSDSETPTLEFFDISSQNTTASANISSFPICNTSDISTSPVSPLNTLADISDSSTPLESTGVEGSCEVDSEATPAKSVCSDNKDIQVSV